MLHLYAQDGLVFTLHQSFVRVARLKTRSLSCRVKSYPQGFGPLRSFMVGQRHSTPNLVNKTYFTNFEKPNITLKPHYNATFGVHCGINVLTECYNDGYTHHHHHHHHHHHLLLKRPFFHAKLGLDVCPKSSHSTYL